MRIDDKRYLLAATLLATVLVSSAVRADPAVPAAGEAEKLAREGNAAVRDGDLDVAEDKYQQAEVILPDSGPIQQKRAEIAELRRDFCEAARRNRRAASIAMTQGKVAIAETLGQKARAQEGQCRAVIDVSVEGPCADSTTTITVSSKGSAPPPADPTVNACQHAFQVSAVGLASKASAAYEVTVSQPGKKSITREIEISRAGHYPLGIGPLRAPGLPGAEGEETKPDKPGAPSSAREETSRILFGIGVGSTVLATALGTTAALLGVALFSDDPGYVAVPILAGTAVALGGTGIILVVSNLPSGRRETAALDPRRDWPPPSPAAIRGTPMLGVGVSF